LEVQTDLYLISIHAWGKNSQNIDASISHIFQFHALSAANWESQKQKRKNSGQETTLGRLTTELCTPRRLNPLILNCNFHQVLTQAKLPLKEITWTVNHV